MTIGTNISSQTFLGNSVTTVFTCNFVPDSATYIVASLTASSTGTTILASNLYSLNIGAPPVNNPWAQNFTITYPLSGPAMPTGASLTVSRVLPFQQNTSFINQGNVWPTAVETTVDILEMQIQQLSARTTQWRGIWATGIYYNVGDIVQDGVNGLGTNNYYICQVANTSAVWTTDYAAGDWAISAIAPVPTGSVTLAGDVIGLSGANTIAANKVTNAKLAQIPPNSVLGNNTSSTATALYLSASQLQALLNLGASIPTTINGLLLTSIAGNATTGACTVTSGSCSDSTNAVLMIGAGYSWAVSNGNAALGFQGGTTLPNSSTIHLALCQGASGTTVFADTQLPVRASTGYTTYQRRIGGFNTTAGGAPIPYTAIEAEGGSTINWLTTQILDFNSGISTTRSMITLTVLSGLKIQPYYRLSQATGTAGIILTSGDETDVAPVALSSGVWSNVAGDDGAQISTAGFNMPQNSPTIAGYIGQIADNDPRIDVFITAQQKPQE